VTSTPQSSPDWDRLHEKIASDNNASRKAAVRDARTTFVNHLTALGFPPYKGQVFEATLAAAKAGWTGRLQIGDARIAVPGLAIRSKSRPRARRSMAPASCSTASMRRPAKWPSPGSIATSRAPRAPIGCA